ncbi:YkvI family membrane protein [Luteimonas deserti]|uniref:Membrane protein YkvI n=1 Tax=Luteimonas deserti TaxID=2752306 RepID=A0A7Z0QQL6_9GAMM|nr:hypothetical protein [Luteimonas deserti]NYZ62012.1 hypothetical protein [Luteimonas deserti]
MFKRALGIGMAFIGLIVGAGFASGQEMLQFFVAFGLMGIVGAFIASVIMILIGVASLQLGSHVQAKEHTAVFRRVSHPALAWFLDAATITTLFAIGFVMFAGGGANMSQQFGWPVWVGAVLTLLAVLVAGMFDVDKVSRLIGLITPFIVLFLLGASGWTLLTAPYNVVALDLAAGNVQTSLPNWWVGALNYVGLCAITGVSMTIVIGGSMLDSRTAGLAGLIGGSMYLLLLMLAVCALFLRVDVIGGDALPMLTLVNELDPRLGAAMSAVIFGMIFNTALGMFYALGKRLTRARPERFRQVYVASVLVGFGLSFVGFRALVSFVYPVLGYMGLVLIAVLATGWLQRRARISAEAKRRLRLRRLAMRRLDPRRRFTAAHAAKVEQLSSESNLADAALHEALVDRAQTALAADPDVDYTLLPADANATEVLTQAEPSECQASPRATLEKDQRLASDIDQAR